MFYSVRVNTLTPYVADEWSPLKAAAVYPRAGVELYCRRGDLSVPLAELLKGEGVELVQPGSTEKGQPLYARDPLVVIDDAVFVSPIHSPGRRGEDAVMCAALQERNIAHAASRVHGGNVLLFPDGGAIVGYDAWKEDPSETSYCEEPHESDLEILAQVRTLRQRALHVCHYEVHIDCAVAPLPDGNILYHRQRLADAGVRALKTAFGTDMLTDIEKGHHHRPILNLFWVNPGLVLTPDSDVCRLLEDRRYEVWKIWGDWKMQGSVRCCIAPLLRKS